MSAQGTVVETVERPNVTVLETLEPPKVETPAAEPVAEEPVAEAAAEETADDGQERDDKGQFRPKRGVQERIDELTREKHESAREAAYWRGIAETRAAQETPKTEAEPKAEDFQDYAEYVRALAKFEAKALVKAELAQEKAATTEAAKATTWQQRESAAKADLPDYDQVVGASRAPMTQAMAEAIRESDIGPKVAYHLAQNPDVSARLAGLSATSAIREIGKLEATLSAAAPPPPQRRITSAPTPPTPVGSGRSTVGDPGKMSQADYLEWRKTAIKESR